MQNYGSSNRVFRSGKYASILSTRRLIDTAMVLGGLNTSVCRVKSAMSFPPETYSIAFTLSFMLAFSSPMIPNMTDVMNFGGRWALIGRPSSLEGI